MTSFSYLFFRSIHQLKILLDIFGIKLEPVDLSVKFKLWVTFLWILILNVQSGLYIFILYALPDLAKAFLPILKGVGSQMTSLIAFISHLNTFLTGVSLHLLLIFTTRKIMRLYLTALVVIYRKLNRPNDLFWRIRRLSIYGIFLTLLSVNFAKRVKNNVYYFYLIRCLNV